MNSSTGAQTAQDARTQAVADSFTPTPQPLYAHYKDNTPEYREKENRWIYRVTIEYDENQPVGKRLSVDLDTFFISKKDAEQILWHCHVKGASKALPFSVDFCKDGCPFEYTQFNQDNPLSGPARRDVLADPTRIYHYVIKVADDVLDPGGGVKA
ncbi:MAG TPA: hypothetical protein VMH31_00610 [Methylomirabilota bacterium]|nr:hypothetical protein [Methylomirabilota bacterium]